MNNELFFLRKMGFLFLVLTGLVSGCKVKKDVSQIKPTEKDPQIIMQKVWDNNVPFETLSIKASVDADFNGEEKSFKSTIRIYKDSAIWMSVAPMAGIELLRILITKDSVKAMDRIHSTYYCGDFNVINAKFNTDLNFNILQSMLSGYPLPVDMDTLPTLSVQKGQYLISTVGKGQIRSLEHFTEKIDRYKGRKQDKIDKKEEKVTEKIEKQEDEKAQKKSDRIDKKETKYSGKIDRKTEKAERKASRFDQDVVFSLHIEPLTYKVLKQSLYLLEDKKYIEAEFSEFVELETDSLYSENDNYSHLIPTFATYRITGGNETAELKIKYSKVTRNKPVNFSFRVPSKYEQVEY